MNKKHVNLLYEDLSYQIRGAAIEIRKQFGCGHKEVLYQRALAEELINFNSDGVNIKRIIYTNDRKKHIHLVGAGPC
jgi:hypothetical protein